MISSSAGDNPRAGGPLTIGIGGRAPCVPCGAASPDHDAGYRNGSGWFTAGFLMLGEAIAMFFALVGLVGLAGRPPRQWAVVTLGWFAVIAFTLHRGRNELMKGAGHE